MEFVDSSGAAVTQVADGVIDLKTPRSRVAALPRDLTFRESTPMGPPQNDEFDESVQEGPPGRKRLCLLKGCERPFRPESSPGAVLFSGVQG